MNVIPIVNGVCPFGIGSQLCSELETLGKNQLVLSTRSTLPALFLKLIFILLHWVSVVALGLSCSEACRNLSSQARDQTHIPCTGRQMLNHGTTREVPPPAL